MRAFVMAAGLGMRLGPLGEKIPKALLPLGGVPLIRFALENLREAGVGEAVVNLHHRGGEVRAALGDETAGVRIHYSEEPELLGTAGGLKKAEDFLREGGGPFFVLNADAPARIDLSAALAHHREGGYLATLVLRESPEGARYGLLGVDAAGRLRRFLKADAPGTPSGALTEAMFTGACLMEPAFLDRIPAGRFCSISKEIYPPLIEEGAPLGAVLSGGYWADAGTPSRYLEANFDLLAGRHVPAFPWPSGGDFFLGGKEVAWGEGTLRPPVLAGRGVRLGLGAVAGPFAVLGENATLSEGAAAGHSVLLPNSAVGKDVALKRCILGPGAVADSSNSNAFFSKESKNPFPFDADG
ncbi:MAG: NDP-sugar synthase [bacterium]|nr:NDP-sugar synthase [bacterium]